MNLLEEVFQHVQLVMGSFKDKSIHVIGGGDSAMEEAIFLTKFASKVTIVHRRDLLRASKIMVDRAISNKKIDFLWNAEPIEFIGDKEKGVYAMAYKDTKTKEQTQVNTDGVFIAIGHNPNTNLFKDILNIDSNGYLITEDKSSRTNIKGVFASGEMLNWDAPTGGYLLTACLALGKSAANGTLEWLDK